MAIDREAYERAVAEAQKEQWMQVERMKSNYFTAQMNAQGLNPSAQEWPSRSQQAVAAPRSKLLLLTT